MTQRVQLRDHFDRFVDRAVHYPGYVLTDAAWAAFKKSETYGKKSLTAEELALAKPLFGAKWSYEITIQSLWQEMSECWSSGFGWDSPLRATISSVWNRRAYDGEGNAARDPRGNRVFLRALFKIRHAILETGFISTMMAYTGLTQRQKTAYLERWEGTNAKYFA